jgi:dipeptidyl aminopeptidase/acylaminoacyl peptidase
MTLLPRLGLCCSGLLLPLLGYPATPTEPGPQHSRIAFASKVAGDWEIFLVDPDDPKPVRLTSRPTQERFPVWSPQGTHLAFGSVGAGRWELWVMESDGTHQIRLAPEIIAKSPRTWSPDGRRIAFAAGRRGSGDICVAGIDGAGLTRLTGDSTDDPFASALPATAPAIPPPEGLVSREARDQFSPEADRTAIRTERAGDAVEKCSLARAVGAHHPQDFAVNQGEPHVPEGT